MKLSFPLSLLLTGSLVPTVSGISVPYPSKSEIDSIEAKNSASTGPVQFAVTNKVEFNPCNAGEISGRTWNLVVDSPGAKNINFGFSKLQLSGGAKMRIKSAKDSDEIQVDANKNASGQYWSRVIRTDQVTISIDFVGEVSCDNVKLTSINVGFRGFGVGDKSGSCNVDVVCPDGDGWEKEISSVAVYSKGGSLACTGAMINNMEQDGTPYFLTANHCGVNPGNAASVVTYWNYETSVCGGNPDGTLNQSLSGATHIVSNPDSDMTLLLLNDEPPIDYGVTFAGWDSTPEVYDLPGVAIHHPAVDEKRISFENDPMASTSYGGNSVSPSGTHVKVYDWDSGTTEPGSSGSPLFNGNHRIIGQLHGGSAACGNNAPDWYGRVSRSWIDQSAFRDSLDPNDTFGGGVGGIDSYDPYESPTVSPRPTASPTEPQPTESPTPCVGSNFLLSLLSDDYGSEISWTLTNQGTDNEVASGGPYGNAQLYEVEQCINEGCYEFVIVDSFGDGICCGFGEGSYVITIDGVIEWDSGGDFGSSESREFCVTSATCVDSGVDIDTQNNSFTCAQVATGGGCTNPVAASHCPLTCDACNEYSCEDSQAPWIVRGYRLSCGDLAALDASTISQACEQDFISTTCRDLCGFC